MMKQLKEMQEIHALQLKLMTEEDLSMMHAALMAENALYRFDERVQAGVRLWLEDQLTDDFAVEDITLGDIREETGASPFCALNMLDICLKHESYVEMAMWIEGSDTIQ